MMRLLPLQPHFSGFVRYITWFIQLELLIFEAQLMPLVGLLKFVSFTRSLVIKFWATAPAVNALV